jgi:hypothetical protein
MFKLKIVTLLIQIVELVKNMKFISIVPEFNLNLIIILVIFKYSILNLLKLINHLYNI